MDGADRLFFDSMFVGTTWLLNNSGLLGQEVSVTCKQQIRERLSRRGSRSDPVRGATAVYRGDLYQNNLPLNKQAIVKIFMQVPYDNSSEVEVRHPDEYAEQAIQSSNAYLTESRALQDLKDCPFTPTMYDCLELSQTGRYQCWVTGGYLNIIVMEKLPGITLEDPVGALLGRPDELVDWERVKMRQGLKRALSSIWKHGIHQKDMRQLHAIWNWREMKCYLIDFEYISERRTTGNWADQGVRPMDNLAQTLRPWGSLH